MANKLYEEESIQAIADAIRTNAPESTGDTTYTVAEMPAGIATVREEALGDGYAEGYSAGKAEGGSANADWSENDPEAEGYIKNRPFYKETVMVAEQEDVFEGTYTSTSQEELGGAFAVLLTDVYKDKLTLRREYVVSFNGVDYSASTGFAVMNYLCYGNLSMLNPMLGTEYEDTGEPFIIAVANAATFLATDFTQSTTNDWRMYAPAKYEEKIVTLPEEFIPFGGVGTGGGAEIFNLKTNIASGAYSHAEGTGTTASGYVSHAEGSGTIASGEYSHAEGKDTEAEGDKSHAEGSGAEAIGASSHAEGFNTKATGNSSHAEGNYTEAIGLNSHAEGLYTIASGPEQHVQGRRNIKDTENKYAHIVGNGTGDTLRSNAHTLDWNGVGWFAGDVKVGGTGQDDENAKTLATTEYVDSLFANIARGDEVEY